MASKGAIATISHLAFKRLYQAMTDISTAYPDVEPAVLPSYRDPRYQEAARYDAVANWAARLAAAMGVSGIPVVEEVVPEEEIPDDDGQSVVDLPDDDTGEQKSVYAGMTKKELKALAQERGVDLTGLGSNDDIIDALEAADG